jgi:AMMECR1 domain-containing protein
MVGSAGASAASSPPGRAWSTSSSAWRSWPPRGNPRYTPVPPDELTDLRYEVSLLGELEPATGLADLDPRVHGLMVQAERRRGGLLPGVPGVETAAQQVVIARIKAGIRPDDPVRLFRFRARRYAEPGVDPGDPREPD